jgi:hypothetical protein
MMIWPLSSALCHLASVALLLNFGSKARKGCLLSSVLCHLSLNCGSAALRLCLLPVVLRFGGSVVLE